jgi:hypothetical protein
VNSNNINNFCLSSTKVKGIDYYQRFVSSNISVCDHQKYRVNQDIFDMIFSSQV